MINVSNYKEILVKDVKKSEFELDVSTSSHGSQYRWNLDASDFIEGGRLSTGNILSDIMIYINSKFKDLTTNLSIQNVEIADVTSLNDVLFADKYDHTIHVGDIFVTNEFEKLHGVGTKFFFAAMFINKWFQGTTNDNAPIGERYTFNSTYLDLDMVHILDMLVRIFMYSQSQSYRDKLTANACFKVSHSKLGSYRGSSEDSDIFVYEKLLDDYVSISSSYCLRAREIYPLSRSNNSKSSKYRELISRIDRLNNLELLKEDMDSDVTVLSTMPRMIGDSNSLEIFKHVFIINSYKRVEQDCMVSASIYCRYKEGDKEVELNEKLLQLFYRTDCSSINKVKDLYNKFKTHKCMRYENIVFDKDVNDIISNPLIELEMSYTTYTSSGGARLYDYKQLKDKKITPTKRRDALYEACCDLVDISNINKNKLFLKLDVDFKRFYGHAK